MPALFPALENKLAQIQLIPLDETRKEALKPLIEYIKQKKAANQAINLHFICTHNSRRSQLAQVWAQTLSTYYNLNIPCFSGGVEVTAFHPNAVQALINDGFIANKKGETNPTYRIHYHDQSPEILAYSKLYNDTTCPSAHFAAIMTCAEADENCPVIQGAEQRIPIRYQDPKAFDHTEQAPEAYLNTSRQIAAEMNFVFSQI